MGVAPPIKVKDLEHKNEIDDSGDVENRSIISVFFFSVVDFLQRFGEGMKRYNREILPPILLKSKAEYVGKYQAYN